jgi:HD-like signal output (HDOD) protein
VLPQLIAAMNDETNTTGEVERVIKLDASLAGATVRLANSSFFGGKSRIETVSDAVITLGQRELFRLASISLLSRWEDAHSTALPWEPGDYARHSLCTALAAEVLAEDVPGNDPEIAYTCGLVCDIGKLVLAFFCSEYYPQIAEQVSSKGLTWEEAETSVLGYNHSKVGAHLLKTWMFPSALSRAVQYQFRPSEASSEVQPQLALLQAARYVAVCLGPGVTEGGFHFKLDADLLERFGYKSESIEHAIIEVRERFLKRMGTRVIGASDRGD